ncbi:hypothetical protein QR680_008279 [Steinernema hermaphroditum]|uniref:SH2 domain-containing protein n=1 Tax=Steinernema hermaphroditum TaxID=289476 RepID=A0AA39II76_9BILA|nr:hypothetical protein QR680_008279 [Steinernema hermaphroditum]
MGRAKNTASRCCCHGRGCQVAEEEKKRVAPYETVDPGKMPLHVKGDQIDSMRLTMSAETAKRAEQESVRRAKARVKKETRPQKKRRQVERCPIRGEDADAKDHSEVETSRYENVERVKSEDVEHVSVKKPMRKTGKSKGRSRSKSTSDRESQGESDVDPEKTPSVDDDCSGSAPGGRRCEKHSLWTLLKGPERKYINEIPRRAPPSSSVYEMVGVPEDLLNSDDDTPASNHKEKPMDKDASDLIGDRIGQFYLGAVKEEEAEKLCRRRAEFRFYHQTPEQDFDFNYDAMPPRLTLWMVYRTRKGAYRHFAVQKRHGKWAVVDEQSEHKKFSYFNNLIRHYTEYPEDLEGDD